MTTVGWSITEDIVPLLGFLAAMVAVLMVPVRPGGVFSRAAKVFFFVSILCYFISAFASILGHFTVLPAGIKSVMPMIELLWVPFILFGVYALYSHQQLNDSNDVRHEVARASRMLESVMDTAPAGIVVLDDAGRITFANPEARRLLDIETEDVAHMDEAEWSVRVGDDVADATARHDFRDLLGPDPLQNAPVSVSWPNGWRRRLLVNTTPIADDPGAASAVVVAFVEREPWTPAQRAAARTPV
jgi:PAS domain-containing protein